MFGGGFPGMEGMGRGGRRRQVDNTGLYKALVSRWWAAARVRLLYVP
jgi:hypothetical protein